MDNKVTDNVEDLFGYYLEKEKLESDQNGSREEAIRYIQHDTGNMLEKANIYSMGIGEDTVESVNEITSTYRDKISDGFKTLDGEDIDRVIEKIDGVINEKNTGEIDQDQNIVYGALSGAKIALEGSKQILSGNDEPVYLEDLLEPFHYTGELNCSFDEEKLGEFKAGRNQARVIGTKICDFYKHVSAEGREKMSADVNIEDGRVDILLYDNGEGVETSDLTVKQDQSCGDGLEFIEKAQNSESEFTVYFEDHGQENCECREFESDQMHARSKEELDEALEMEDPGAIFRIRASLTEDSEEGENKRRSKIRI